MRIVTVYLKSNWAPNGLDWDRGIVRTQDKDHIALSDNEYGLTNRTRKPSLSKAMTSD